MASTVIGGSAVSTTLSGVLTPRNTYSTLTRLRADLSLASQNTADDNALKRFLYSASRAIDKKTRRQFYPQRGTTYHNLPDSTYTLRVDFDLLEVKGLSDMNGASTINSGVYWLKCGDDWNKTPYDRVEINESSGSTFNYSGTPQRAVHLDAIRGYHEDYSNAWVNTGASTTAALTATAKTLTISGSAGEDIWGLAPRVDVHQIIKIDDEFMHIVDGNGASIITVLRGINGTTAATHASAATVYRFDFEPDVEYSARRLAAFQYHKNLSPFTNRVASLQLGIIETPEAWPEEVADRLSRLIRTRIGAL